MKSTGKVIKPLIDIEFIVINSSRILSISLPTVPAPQRQSSIAGDGRYCWVCFATDEEDQESGGVVEWIKPCKCKGTLRWVHQSVSGNFDC